MKKLYVLIVLLAIAVTSCSKMFGVRKDFDDSGRFGATSGGVWPERQMLSNQDLDSQSVYDDYGMVGHNERPSPSSYRNNRHSWANPNSDDQYQPGENEIRDQAAAAQARMNQGGQKFKNGVRASRADFWDESQNEGSLWASNGQTNYFFTKNSVKGVGDIISINLQDRFISDIAAELKRNLTEDEMDIEVSGIQKKADAKMASASSADDKKAGAAASPPPAEGDRSPANAAKETMDPAVEMGQRKAGPQDVDLTKKIGLNAGETVMAEIMERYPSGNYKIRGTKRFNFNGTPQLLTFVGIARPIDINEQDTMDSGKLYEYRLGISR